MKKKRALITGITGQDGSYLAEFLLTRGYEVFGLERRNSQRDANRQNIQHLLPRIELISGDLLDRASLDRALEISQPDEVYNLGAQSFVHASFDLAEYTAQVTGIGTQRLLDAVRQTKRNIKFYQASSSEMFGAAEESPQNELTRFHPRSPYASAKVFAHNTAVNYREAYGMFNACGILFNHESPRRGIEFVTRKITHGVAKIKLDIRENFRFEAKQLLLGNLSAKRDWGFAGDYVEAMWLMLQQAEPKDYVIATGSMHSVGEFVEAAFERVGLNWKFFVKTDQKFMRPSDVTSLCGDASRAREELGWQPKVSFEELVAIMVDADIAAFNEIK